LPAPRNSATVACFALQFGFESSLSELRLRVAGVETELSVEKAKCLMLRKELLRTDDDARGRATADDDDQRHQHVQLAELQVTYVAMLRTMCTYYKSQLPQTGPPDTLHYTHRAIHAQSDKLATDDRRHFITLVSLSHLS